MNTDQKKGDFYITTTLPYVNAEPHVGFAMEIIRADVIARFKKLMGYDVFFNTGTDEHGQKLFEAAAKEGKPVQEYVDGYAAKFRGLVELLGISPDVHFIRTTDAHHEKAAQEFWKRCNDNGYIYKKNYQAKYCVGCEENKTESELVDGRCPLHPNRELEIRDEENYFFKYSAFGEKLLAFYEANPDFVTPAFRLNEMKEFIKRGLEDFSISRLKSKMSWGIPVPNDSDHVMYVWFDALTNYISTLGWPDNTENFDRFWKNGTPVQYCGKDNTRFQSAMWQAMLMAAGLPQTNKVIVNGFVTGDAGVKMSKSLGNVINPYDVVNEYGTDALRYFVLREIHPFEDSPFTMERFKESYNANLANGLGNLVSRVMRMATGNNIQFDADVAKNFASTEIAKNAYEKQMRGFENFNMQMVSDAVWDVIGSVDKYIQENQPFKVIKTDVAEGTRQVKELLARLDFIAVMSQPLLPQTATKISELLKENKMPEAPLFLRKD